MSALNHPFVLTRAFPPHPPPGGGAGRPVRPIGRSSSHSVLSVCRLFVRGPPRVVSGNSTTTTSPFGRVWRRVVGSSLRVLLIHTSRNACRACVPVTRRVHVVLLSPLRDTPRCPPCSLCFYSPMSFRAECHGGSSRVRSRTRTSAHLACDDHLFVSVIPFCHFVRRLLVSHFAPLFLASLGGFAPCQR